MTARGQEPFQHLLNEKRKSAGSSGGRCGVDDVGDPQSVFAVDDDDFAVGDEASVVEQQIYG